MAVATSTAIALALMAASTAATAYNAKQTGDKADNQAASGIRQQAANQAEVNSRLNKTIGDVGKSTLAPVRDATTKNYLNQVQTSLAQANAGLNQRGISQQFDEMAGGAANDAKDYGDNAAKLLGTIDAAGMQRQNEGNQFGKLGQDLSIMEGNIKGDAFLNEMKMRGIKRNPYIDLAAGLMSSGAGAAASSGTGTYGGQTGFNSSADLGTAANGSSNIYPGGWST